MPAPSNDPLRRVQAVERLLVTRTPHGSGLLVDPDRCPVLFEGFERGYKFRRMQTGGLSPTPEKNEFSHIHDALQYAAMGHQNHFAARRLQSLSGERRFPRPEITAAAWT